MIAGGCATRLRTFFGRPSMGCACRVSSRGCRIGSKGDGGDLRGSVLQSLVQVRLHRPEKPPGHVLGELRVLDPRDGVDFLSGLSVRTGRITLS